VDVAVEALKYAVLLMGLRRLLAGEHSFSIGYSFLLQRTLEVTPASLLIKLCEQPFGACSGAAMIFMKSLLSGLALLGGSVQFLV